MPPFNRKEILERLAKRKQSDGKADAGSKKRVKTEDSLPSPPAPPAKGGTAASARATATPQSGDRQPAVRDAAPSTQVITADDIRELKSLISSINTPPTSDPAAVMKTLVSDSNAQHAEELQKVVKAIRDDVASQIVAEIKGVLKAVNNVELGVVGLHSMHKDLAQEVSKSHTAVLDALKPVGDLEQRLESITERQKTALSSTEDFHGQLKAVFLDRDNCLRINKDLHRQFEDAANTWEGQVVKNLDSGIIDDQLQKISRNGTHTAPHK